MIWRPLTLAAIIYLYLPLSPCLLCLFTALPKKYKVLYFTQQNCWFILPQPPTTGFECNCSPVFIFRFRYSSHLNIYVCLYTYSSLVANKVIAWGMNALSIQRIISMDCSVIHVHYVYDTLFLHWQCEILREVCRSVLKLIPFAATPTSPSLPPLAAHPSRSLLCFRKS